MSQELKLTNASKCCTLLVNMLIIEYACYRGVCPFTGLEQGLNRGKCPFTGLEQSENRGVCPFSGLELG